MKKYIALAAVALMVAGCENGGNINIGDPNEIRVNAVVGTRVEGTAFESGDTFGLYAVEYDGEEVAELQPVGNYINNEAMELTDGVWRSDRTLYWSEKPCDFYGIYPHQELPSMSEVLFEVATDQSQPSADGVLGGYEASDLLWAKAEKVSRESGAVNLQFYHMLSRVVVNIERGPEYEGELPEDIDVHIYNTATTALIDWRIGSLEKYLYSPTKTIKMKKLDGDSFAAIVVPQFIERSTPLIEVTMEGIAYLLNYSMSFRPGYQHTVTVTLNTSPDQEKIEINISGDVGGFN